MSDEPKSRSRASIGWALVAVIAWLLFWQFASGAETERLAWAHAVGLFVAPCIAVGGAFGHGRLGAAIGLAALFSISLSLTIAGMYAARSH